LRSDPPPALSGKPPHVLVVDDEPAQRRSLARALMAQGFVVDTAESGAAALDLARTRPLDAVLLDHGMPGGDGLAVLSMLRGEIADVEVVLMVALGDETTARSALAAGAFAIVYKPIASADAVAALLERATERRRLVDRARSLSDRLADHEPLGDIVTASARMEEVLRRAWSAAASSAPVLLLGERGTGKDLVARALHRRSPRAREPLVVLSPDALPEARAAAELAAALARAEGGTLLVDDLGALPRLAQADLFAALTTQRPDVRLVATALPALRERVASGDFRADLFYAAASILLEIPPLRRRREDIPLLAYHFLNRYAAREHKPIRRIGAEALRKLREHAWPGNVGELRGAIEHAVVTARSDAIVPSDLPLGEAREEDEGDGERAPAFAAAPAAMELPYAEAKEQVVSAFDKAYVARVMRRAEGNVSEAARLAGMDRSNFRRLMKKVKRNEAE
jgi:DNA-binding NtrC family response regulator